MALTDVAIRAIKTTGEKQKLSDGGGLQLWVSPQGTKTWRFAYRYFGKQKDTVLEHAVKKWNPVFQKKACDNNKIRV